MHAVGSEIWRSSARYLVILSLFESMGGCLQPSSLLLASNHVDIAI